MAPPRFDPASGSITRTRKVRIVRTDIPEDNQPTFPGYGRRGSVEDSGAISEAVAEAVEDSSKGVKKGKKGKKGATGKKSKKAASPTASSSPVAKKAAGKEYVDDGSEVWYTVDGSVPRKQWTDAELDAARAKLENTIETTKRQQSKEEAVEQLKSLTASVSRPNSSQLYDAAKGLPMMFAGFCTVRAMLHKTVGVSSDPTDCLLMVEKRSDDWAVERSVWKKRPEGNESNGFFDAPKVRACLPPSIQAAMLAAARLPCSPPCSAC